MTTEISHTKCCCIGTYLVILILIINPLSQYWTLISYQFKFYETLSYPLHEFKPNLPSITNHCIVHPWMNKDRLWVYDCTDIHTLSTKPSPPSKQYTIAIASFHHYPNKQELTRYEKLILSNHIGYCIKHRYIYFDVNNLIFDDKEIKKYFDATIPSANAIFKAQKPFIIHSILNDDKFKDVIDYVLWIDFDAIFFNCSTSIESIINYTHNLYTKSREYSPLNNNDIDIIFTRDYFSMTNSGVIIYKNTNWTKQLLLKQMYVFQNAKDFQFSNIYLNVRHLIDQNVFNALIMGFDPPLNDTKYLKSGKGYLELKKILKYELKIHDLIPKFQSFPKCMDDEHQFLEIHDKWIGENIRKHCGMIPQFYINVLMGEWIYANYYQKNKFPYDPIIVHFASSIGKPYLSSPNFKELRCSVDDYTP